MWVLNFLLFYFGCLVSSGAADPGTEAFFDQWYAAQDYSFFSCVNVGVGGPGVCSGPAPVLLLPGLPTAPKK